MKKIIVLIILLIASTSYANPFGGMIASSGGVLSPYRLTWDCDDLTAEIYDPDDGGTFTVSSGSVSYVTGVTSNAACYAKWI